MRNPKNTTSEEEDQATDTWTASLLAMSLVMCPPNLEPCQIPTCGNNSDRFLDFKSMAWIMVIINIYVTQPILMRYGTGPYHWMAFPTLERSRLDRS